MRTKTGLSISHVSLARYSASTLQEPTEMGIVPSIELGLLDFANLCIQR